LRIFNGKLCPESLLTESQRKIGFGWCPKGEVDGPNGCASLREQAPDSGGKSVMDETTEKPGWKQRAKREFISYWINVLYLSIVFGLFTWYRRLILARYDIAYMHYGVAIVEALVLAKVILIGDMMGLSRHYFEGKPLIYPTLYKSLVFTLFVAVFRMMEETITGFMKGKGMDGWLETLHGTGKYEFLAHGLMVFFMFIPFFAFKEIGKILGKGSIGRLFFRENSLPAA
jgi:hypothetical protein